MSYTKGPWHWSPDAFRDGYSALLDNNDDPVLYPQRENDGDDGAAWFGTDEDYYGETALTEANANLIAAAPELFELLEIAACPQCDGSGAFYDNHGEVCQCQWCDERKKAIAKAKGQL